MNVGSLFSGIGGFDLGLERAGMRVVWQCESDDFCRRVLAKHWPDVPCFEDVRDLRGTGREAVASVDVLCGGFPCQDLSYAGKGAGITGARSGLWSEYARLIGELRPRYVVVENVSALLARGLSVVLGDLAALGYDAEWDCIPASAVGAPHRRDRIWLVAYSNNERAYGSREQQQRRRQSQDGCGAVRGDVADAGRIGRRQGPRKFGGLGSEECGWWSVEPDVGRVAHGVPHRVDRLRSLGNALVPQIAEWIGKRIMSHEESCDA
jgi:DNA (cytosine-5)-methyltransferase 1